MGHVLRSQEPIRRAKPTTRRRLLTILGTLATVLSLTLGACSGPTLPDACHPSGDAPLRTPGYSLPVTLPLVVNGVVYVGYAPTDPPGDPLAGADLARNYANRFALAALRARDGTTLWRVPTARGNWPFTVTGAWPLTVADGVLVAYDTGFDARGLVGLVGLRASDGATIWRTPLGYRTMTASGGVVYVTTNDGVSALRIVDGSLLWSTPVRGTPLTAPLIVGASLYVATTYGSVVALRADTGVVRWKDVPDPISQYLPLGVIAGWLYVYAPSDEPHGIAAGVLRLNPASGASQGYVLRLPPFTEALFPTLQAGVFYALLLPFGPSSATTPQPLPTVVAYRLGASSGSQLLWRTPLQQSDSIGLGMAAHDTQALYFLTADLAAGSSWTITAFSLADGALLWRRQALGRTGFAVGAGELVEIAYGAVSPCDTPPMNQAPQIRADASVDGHVTWTHALDATL